MYFNAVQLFPWYAKKSGILTVLATWSTLFWVVKVLSACLLCIAFWELFLLHFIITTFSFTAFIFGEFTQRVNGIAYLMPGCKAEVWIVKDEASNVRVTAKTGLLRSWIAWLSIQNKYLHAQIQHLRCNLCITNINVLAKAGLLYTCTTKNKVVMMLLITVLLHLWQMIIMQIKMRYYNVSKTQEFEYWKL